MRTLFELGNSITVDPISRKVTHIDGIPVKMHTNEMQEFANAALEPFAVPFNPPAEELE